MRQTSKERLEGDKRYWATNGEISDIFHQHFPELEERPQNIHTSKLEKLTYIITI